MNFRAPLHEADIRRNLAPVEPNVTKLPPAGPPPPCRGETLDALRRDALEALHSYVCAATGNEHPRSMTIFRRVLTTLDNQLAAGRQVRTPNKLLRLAREGLPHFFHVLAYYARTDTTPERREASITYVTEEES